MEVCKAKRSNRNNVKQALKKYKSTVSKKYGKYKSPLHEKLRTTRWKNPKWYWKLLKLFATSRNKTVDNIPSHDEIVYHLEKLGNKISYLIHSP